MFLCVLFFFFFKQKTAYDIGLGIPAEPLFRSHDGGYYTVKDCVTIDVLPRTPGNNVYVGFMVWSNFTATDRSRARRCVEACVYGTLDFVGYPRFPEIGRASCRERV